MKESLEDRLNRLTDGPRMSAVESLAKGLAGEREVGDQGSHALAMLVVDATLDGDEAALYSAWRQLQHLYRLLSRRIDERAAEDVAEDRGRILAYLDVVMWALDRNLSLRTLSELEGDSAAHEFLKVVSEEPGLSNAQLADKLDMSETEVSRLGRRLADASFAAKRRIGRRNRWEVTPKGLQTLDLLEGGGVSRFQRPTYELR